MSKHTAGPWQMVETRKHFEIHGGPRTYVIVRLDVPDEDPSIYECAKADATMMAASPKMQEACRAALALLTDDGTQGGRSYTLKLLRDAIAASEPK